MNKNTLFDLLILNKSQVFNLKGIKKSNFNKNNQKARIEIKKHLLLSYSKK